MQSNPCIEVGGVLDGKYRIEHLIGAGAMGSVYAGTHVALDRTVAIKILHPWLAGDPRACQRFLQEAHAIGSLNHKNVVSVDGCGRTGDYIYIAMDYLEGESLSQMLKTQGRLAAESAVSIVAEAARGLSHAHAAGILHRDVKPSNIMLCRDTTGGIIVKVVDFGIAKVMQSADGAVGAQSLTSTNAALGTPYYMSPEQCARQELDARSDIYSLGCVLFECVSGEVPFEGDSALGIMLAHLHDEPRELLPDVPEWLRTVIYKAMAPNRDERYATMDEFIAALEAKICAPPVVLHKKAPRRNHGTKLALLCAALAGAMVAVGFFVSHPPERTTEPTRIVTMNGDKADQAEEEVGNLLEQARAEYANGKYQEVKDLSLRAIAIGKVTERKARFVYWPCYYVLVNSCIRLGDLTSAESYAKEAINETRDEGSSSAYYAHALVPYADVLYARGQTKDARVVYEQAIKIAQQTRLRGNGHDLNLFHAVEGTLLFASVNYKKLDPDGAVDAVKQIPIITKIEFPHLPGGIARSYWPVCEVQCDVGKFDDARRTFQQCIEYADKVSTGDVAGLRLFYAAKLFQTGMIKESAEQYLAAGKDAQKMPPSKDRDQWLALIKARYAECLQRLNAKRTAPAPN